MIFILILVVVVVVVEFGWRVVELLLVFGACGWEDKLPSELLDEADVHTLTASDTDRCGDSIDRDRICRL